MIAVIAWRELRSLFLSPLAWAILGVVQFIFAYFFLVLLDQFLRLQPQLSLINNAPGVTALVVAPLFTNLATFVFMLVVPLLSMRLISEERRNRTLPLLFSAPVSMSEIILGKYLGLLGFLVLMVLLLTLMPLSLLLGGTLDYGQLAAIVLGFLLLVASFAAVGLYMSSLTAHPAVAAISAIGILLFLWLIALAAPQAAQAGAGGSLLGYLSMPSHFAALARGVFRSSDVAYYLLSIVVCLTLAIRRLDNDRLAR